MKPQNMYEMRKVSDMISMKGKVFFVTGAGGGIGCATAVAFAQLGAHIALMDIPAKEGELRLLCDKIKLRYGVECMYVLGDISDVGSVDGFIAEVVRAYGTIHVVHNNAGIGVWPDHADMSVESWKKIVGINLTGSYLVARTCARIMKEHGHGGSIVTTASVSASIINTGPGYAATKAGAKHMTASLAIEYAKDNIRLNSVSYGYILSGMHTVAGDEETVQALYENMQSSTPMGRIGQLDEVIGIVVYLGSELSSFQTGTDVLVDGGISIGRMN